jgi:hypothetical protein
MERLGYVTSFRDSALLQLSDPAAFGAALAPADGSGDGRVRTILAAAYDLSATRIDQVRSAQVGQLALQRPLFPVGRQDGVWSQTQPSFTRTEFTLNLPAPADPIWIDLLAGIDVTVVAEVDPSGAESVLSRAFDDFTTFDEFRARFSFFDLDAFLARHHISTVEELRDAFDYVVTEIQLRTPGVFDPNDPANTHTLPVTLAAVIVDPFDLAAGLRATRLVRQAAKGLAGASVVGVPAEVTEPYATAVVVAAGGLPDGLTAAQVEQLYAGEGVACLFLPSQ